MLERCAYDTICHEHIEYDSLRQIQWMIERSDLKIVALQINDVNGGSLAVTAARDEAPYRKARKEIQRSCRRKSVKDLKELNHCTDLEKGFRPSRQFIKADSPRAAAGKSSSETAHPRKAT